MNNKRFIHKCLQTIRNCFTLGDLIFPVIILMSINAFWQPFGKPKNPIDVTNTSILAKVDSLSICSSSPSFQRSRLVNVLQERMAIDGTFNSTTEGIKMQIRLFYAAILAGIASLLFRNERDQKNAVGSVLLILIILMYLLEVHRDDLYKRHVAAYTVKGIAVDSLINLSPNDTTWYVLSNDKIRSAYVIAESTRIPRKFLTALQPDPEQLLFYILPLFGIYLCIIRQYLMSRKKSIAT